MPMRGEVVGTLTVALGAQDSNVLNLANLSAARKVIIFGPATLAETATVRVAFLDAAAAADLRDLKVDGGAAITFTGATAMVLDFGGFRSLGLRLGVVAAAERVFTVVATF